ncbi:MAG: hypothetical protein CMJ81_07070 [Planctomycetaceae bacterium]|nr:hypothetical protein [Planctomycetaceae bacterium]
MSCESGGIETQPRQPALPVRQVVGAAGKLVTLDSRLVWTHPQCDELPSTTKALISKDCIFLLCSILYSPGPGFLSAGWLACPGPFLAGHYESGMFE